MSYKKKLYEEYVKSHLTYRKKYEKNSIRISNKGFCQRYLKFIPSDLSSKICDLGCGRGDFVNWLLRRGYKNVYGVDASKEQVELANKLEMENILEADVFDYLMKNKDFDLIVARDLIEHFEHNQVLLFFEKVFECLDKDGCLILQIPNATSPYLGRVLYGDFTHELAFTGNSIRQLMRASGFRNIKIYPWRPVIHDTKSLFRYLAWLVVEFLIKIPIIVESSTDTVVTMNMIVVGKK